MLFEISKNFTATEHLTKVLFDYWFGSNYKFQVVFQYLSADYSADKI